MDRRAVEQPVEVSRLARIAAQQSVIAENPQIARACNSLVRRRRHFVGIAQTFLQVAAQQLCQLVLVKTQQA